MASIFALTDTWNNAAATFTGIGLNVTDSASAAGSFLIDLQVGGASRFSVRKDGFASFASVVTCNSAVTIGGGAAFLQFNGDVILCRDISANVLGLRNGTNAQTFNIYNTFTDASNYERGIARWTSNEFIVGTEAAGTGSNRELVLRVPGTQMKFQTNNSVTTGWQITSGNFLALADNTFDIGLVGANRPRNIYAGTLVQSLRVLTNAQTVSTLGPATAGMRAFVTDSTVAAAGNFGAVVAGGGANGVPVYADGTNWRIG